MPGIVQELNIGRNRYVFGMDWFILETDRLRQQIDEIADRFQTKIGVRTGTPKLNPGVGFCSGLRKPGAVSAAATIARQIDNTILVQPMKALGGPEGLFWMVAVQDRRLVPGTDLVLPEAELVPLVRRYSVLGDFKLVGHEAFFEQHFRELRAGHEFFPQSIHTLENMLLRSPVRLRGIAHQRRRQALLAGSVFGLLAVVVIFAVIWKKHQEQALLQPVEQPTSIEMWRSQLPIVRSQMIKQFEDTLSPVTPSHFVATALERIGGLSPLQDDWYLSEIDCNLTRCQSKWVNNGLSDNAYLWEALRGLGELQFEPTGRSAMLVFPMAIESNRGEISSVKIASLPQEQAWLRTQGSKLQQLSSAGLQFKLAPPKPSQQFIPSPDGTKLIGPDTTFKHGEFKLVGRHYFMISDAVKRLDDEFFSIENLSVKFDDEQEPKGWTLEGRYVWK